MTVVHKMLGTGDKGHIVHLLNSNDIIGHTVPAVINALLSGNLTASQSFCPLTHLAFLMHQNALTHGI